MNFAAGQRLSWRMAQHHFQVGDRVRIVRTASATLVEAVTAPPTPRDTSTVLQARAAERKTPPVGRFMEVDGVRLHYFEQGQGDPVLLIHGNGTLIQDFT